MIVSCYSAKCFPAHWKANVMVIISDGVTDACTRTHNCSQRGTLSKGWMELLMCQKCLSMASEADLGRFWKMQTYLFSTPKKKSEIMRPNHRAVHGSLSSFILKIVCVSIMPQTLSIVCNSRLVFCMMETLKPTLRTKTSRVQSVDIKWSTRDCWAVSESRHRATVHQECMTACVKAWKFQILN